MGLAEEGTPLSYEDTMKWAPHVRKHGIQQFINLYNRQKNRKNDHFKWGDEVEYTITKFNDDKKEVKLNLKSAEVLKELNKDGNDQCGFWAPEYGAFMIEGTPAKPYNGLAFNVVEDNMRKRREEVKKKLKLDEDLLSIVSFPRLGCENFTYPQTEPTPFKGLTKSMFFPDACIYPEHPRYTNTTTNIMKRRGEKPFYNLPVFKDKNTKIPLDDCYKWEKNALPDHVYLDAMGFGCGYSCLQVTFQASDLNEARVLYDQLTPFCPLMIALTAAAPFHRGFITDVDSRWNILCHTQDCRTQEEKGSKPLNKNKFIIKKSRHDSTNCYISSEGENFNDLETLYHKEDYKKLVDNGVDALLSQHIAHLFIRDSISMFEEKLHQNDEEEIDHFENIQSTVWQSMRLKPPPPNTPIGWRVEFRPCDVQITDFENAAVASFLVLLTRIILTYKLNFLIPISKVDENIQRAQTRNAARDQKFWFRKDIFKNVKTLKKDIKLPHNKMQIKRKLVLNEELKNEPVENISSTNKIKKSWNLEQELMDKESSDMFEISNIQFMQKRRRSLQLRYGNDLTKSGLLKKVNSQGEKMDILSFRNFKTEIKFLNNEIFFNKNIKTESTKGFMDKENIIKIIKTANLDYIHSEEESIESECLNNTNCTPTDSTDDCIELTIDEIINGKNEDYPGIIPLMKKYLCSVDLDPSSRCNIQRYLKLIEGRASGKLLTPASWMRKFAMEHPSYKHDSIVTEEMTYDLLKKMQAAQNGEIRCQELLGE